MAQKVTINPDLHRERTNATFDITELTHVFYGGKDKADRYQYLDELVDSDPAYNRSSLQALSRYDALTELIRRHVRALEICKTYNIVEPREKIYLGKRYMNDGECAFFMHYLAFMPMLRLQSTPEQLRKWEPLTESFEMIGCYAQTELGHGSFVRGLETTAVYDPQTKEFVLNTPKITSTKWWAGGLGKVANHAVILAQLYTQGVCHGVQSFLLPLRDSNHQPLPGITVGDIGPKFGMSGMDNGFLRLNNVRIPRENMLMRFSKVLEDGTYVKPENDRIIYGGMLGIRAGLPFTAALGLSVAVTIATRYSCVRRQSELQPGQIEAQVLDYRTQQHKLFPILAMTYAFATVGHSMMDMFSDIMLEIQNGDYRRLIEAHALSSGLKAVITSQTSSAVEICRMSCGGHGFLEASSFSHIYTSNVGTVTAEGEATVLLLQTARYLLKNCAAVMMDKRIDNLTSYLVDKQVLASKRLSENLDLDSLLLAYAVRANRIVSKAADKVRIAITEQGLQQEAAMNRHSNAMVKAALAHVDYVILRLYIERLNSMKLTPPARKAITVLCTLHAIYGLIQNAGDYILEGYLSSSDVELLNDKLFSLYDIVRVDAVSYVDAFRVDSSAELSVLGRYDGNVYESLIKSAESSHLNKTLVHPSYHQYIQKHQADVRARL